MGFSCPRSGPVVPGARSPGPSRVPEITLAALLRLQDVDGPASSGRGLRSPIGTGFVRRSLVGGRSPILQMSCEEVPHLAEHGLLGILLPGEILAAADDAL